MENTNPKKAYKQFAKNLQQIGVADDIIRQNEKEIIEILRAHSVVASNTEGKDQFLGAIYSAETSLRTFSH